jgi:hypothetical protein
LDFLRVFRNIQVSKFWIFPQFLANFRGPFENFFAVSRDFKGWACPKILCGFPAMNRAQNLDLPAVSCNF